jgi:hypothetical protein
MLRTTSRLLRSHTSCHSPITPYRKMSTYSEISTPFGTTHKVPTGIFMYFRSRLDPEVPADEVATINGLPLLTEKHSTPITRSMTSLYCLSRTVRKRMSTGRSRQLERRSRPLGAIICTPRSGRDVSDRRDLETAG